MGQAAMGHQAKAAIDEALPIDTNSLAYEFDSEDIVKRGGELDSNGIRGTIQHYDERTRDDIIRYGGPLSFKFTPTIADIWLPRILGSAAVVSGGFNQYSPAETRPNFYLMFDRATKVFQYDLCKVNRAEFVCSPGQMLVCNLDVRAALETVTAAGSFPALTVPVDAPYTFADAAITLQSVGSRVVTDLRITIENFIEERYAAGSLNPSQLNITDFSVKVSMKNPFSADEVDLYNQATHATGLVHFTNGSKELKFNLNNIFFPPLSPSAKDKKEIPLMLEGTCRRTSGVAYAIRIDNKP